MKSEMKILSEHFMRFHIWKPALINHVKLHFKVWGGRARDKRIADAAWDLLQRKAGLIHLCDVLTVSKKIHNQVLLNETAMLAMV